MKRKRKLLATAWKGRYTGKDKGESGDDDVLIFRYRGRFSRRDEWLTKQQKLLCPGVGEE